jgi:proteasome accessory factor B
LIVAEKALQQYRGTSFEKPLLSAIRKMEQSLPNTISLNLASLEQTISFRTRAEPILNLEVFDQLSRAAAQRQQIELVYRKPGQAKAEKRLVDPYHLANINGEWYLFAYDHARKDIRTFAPTRIQSVTPTGKTFPRPERFSLEKRLRNSFGVHSGEGAYEVVIRFDARVADYILEKKWHESQKLRKLKTGGVELHLKLSSLPEIERWILGWGGDATVVKPPELFAAVRAAATRILNQAEEADTPQANPGKS